MKNVESWNVAVEKGLEPRAYTYEPARIPVGELNAMLDFKIWAKKVSGISCYFTAVNTLLRFTLTVYRDRNTGFYTLVDCPIDFTSCAVGSAYRIKVGLNGKGRPYFISAIPLNRTSNLDVSRPGDRGVEML